MPKKQNNKSSERSNITNLGFESIAENSPNMIFVNDMKTVVYVNKKCIEVMGYSKEEFLSKDFNFLTLIAPESKEEIMKFYQENLKGRDVPPYEYKLITKQGKKIDVIITSKLIPYAGKTAILGIITDISDRKKTELKLTKSEEMFRSIFQTSPDTITISRADDGVFKKVNDAFVKLTGYSREEIIGKSSLDIDIWNDEKDRDMMVKTLNKKGHVFSKEITFRTKNGTSIPTLLSASIVPINDSPHILTMVRNISEIKERIEYEKALFEISNKSQLFKDLDPFLEFCIEKLGLLTNVSRVYIFKNNEDNTLMNNTHEWVNEGVKSFIEELQDVPYADFPYWKKMLESNNIIHATDIMKDLPKELHDILSMQKIRSILVVPLFVRNKFYGFLGFDNCVEAKLWEESDLNLLRTSAQVISGAIGRHSEAKKRKSLEGEITSTQKLLQKIVDSTNEVIVSSDLNTFITSWNKGAEKYSGLKAKDVIGKSIFNVNLEFDKERVQELIEKLMETDRPQKFEMAFHRKDNRNITLSASISLIRDDKNTPTGIVCVATDITPNQIVGKRPQTGNAYMILSERPDVYYDIFEDNIKRGMKGLMISRKKINQVTHLNNQLKFDHLWMGPTEKDSLLAEIDHKIRKYPEGVILFDRIDYLIGLFGFDKFLRFLYRINNNIMGSEAILLVALNPVMVEKKQMFYLEQELIKLETETINDALSSDMFEILALVREKNNLGTSVTINDIVKKFKITRPTANERIKNLIKINYINSEKIGRARKITITRQGRDFLSKTK